MQYKWWDFLQESQIKNEAEYSNDIYSVYSLLKNTELQNSPYQQIIQPVQERTANLFQV